MLKEDRPGIDPELDSLGYKQLAKQLAISICEMSPSEGFVIGLYGKWGTGKTTVLNYIEHFIDQSDAEKPIVVRFNPWWFSGHEDIAHTCLDEIADKLNVENKYLKKAGKLIKGIANALSDAPIPVNLGGFGVTVNSKEVGKAIGEQLSKKKDIPSAKKEVGNLIEKSEQRIAVFVDDIDRLSAEEIRHVFKAIKALGDFKNVIYVLAFDKEVVVSALSSFQGTNGEDYLEKIIQAPFELPLPSTFGLRSMFYESLNPILEKLDEKQFDQYYFENVMRSGVLDFLETPRDVVRLSNTLLVTFPPVIKDVNPSDFIAIESLRVFSSAVYEIIRKNKNMFSGISSKDGYFNESEKVVKAFHEKWSSEIKYFSKIKELLIRIFPKLEIVWKGTSYSNSYLVEWRKQLRICSPERFDTYFAFGLHTDLVSKNELEEFISISNDQSNFSQKLRDYSNVKTESGQTKIPELLENLLDFSDEIQDQNLPTVIASFLEVGDEIVKPEDQMRSIKVMSTTWQILWIIFRLLKRMEKTSRATFLCDQATQSKAIHIFIGTIQGIEDNNSKNNHAFEEFLTTKEVTEIKDILISRIETLIQLKDISKLPRFPYLIHFCEQKMKKRRFEALKKEILSSQELFLYLLSEYFSTSYSSTIGDKVARKKESFNVEGITKLFSAKELIDTGSGMVSKVTGDDKKKLENAIEALQKFLAGDNLESDESDE